MKIKIEIKNSFTGKILFEFETENNTILKTLKEAVKSKKDLQGADLRGADLRGADLQGADLQGADLRGADLRGADLQGADLQGADLQGADLQGADLRGADLQGADLQGADLQGADLRGADLRGADLQGAYLQGADLQGADGENIKVDKAVVLTGLYKYVVIAFITEDNKEYVKMGCYTRLVSEWENDFWNNENEFPNNGDLDSKYRLMAFEFAKQWIELNR